MPAQGVLEVGDIIVSVGDVGVSKAGDLQRLMVEAHIGSKLSLTVLRGEKPIVLDVVPVEQEIARKLFPNVGRNAGRHIVRFDLRERLRGDAASQAQAHAIGRQWGWYSANDVLQDIENYEEIIIFSKIGMSFLDIVI